MTGSIFAIKKYAIHDGPNIRTTIFLKGCPLSCTWCHNPEGIDRKVEIIWNAEKCIGCGQCIESCHEGAVSRAETGLIRDKSKCSLCEKCLHQCPATAHEATGWQMETTEVMKEIEKDIPFFDTSGGGVTFSGGEPLLQYTFLLELLQQCGELRLHRAVDTCCYVDTEKLISVADHCELFLIDLKHMDSDSHLRFTGVENKVILKNIKRLSQSDSDIIIRIPLIAGFNSNEENIKRSADFIASLGCVNQVDLLPYHSIASAKYRKLGKDLRVMNLSSPTKKEIANCVTTLKEAGLQVQVGG